MKRDKDFLNQKLREYSTTTCGSQENGKAEHGGWLNLVILITWEVEIREMWFQANQGKKIREIPISTNKN
jgi:hypothetical protein